MDLIRALLLELEKRPYIVGCHDVDLEGHDSAEIAYHLKMLHDAGFIEAQAFTHGASPYPEWKPKALHGAGTNFLSPREKTRWEKAKKLIQERGSAMTLEAIKVALAELVRKSLTG
jgi:hypothetical protein